MKPTTRIHKKALQKLVMTGKEHGYLTYSEINDILPDDLLTQEQIESIITILKELDISVFNTKPDTDITTIQSQILKIIESSMVSGIKAKDILKKLTISTTKKDVNKLLYGPLKQYVQYDDAYKWSIKADKLHNESISEVHFNEIEKTRKELKLTLATIASLLCIPVQVYKEIIQKNDVTLCNAKMLENIRDTLLDIDNGSYFDLTKDDLNSSEIIKKIINSSYFQNNYKLHQHHQSS